MDEDIKKLNVEAQTHAEELGCVLGEVQKVIVGQDDVLNRLLLALVCGGHVLLEGVPGLAKTLMVKTLSETFNSSFCRIQFTPDLLPADIVGTKIYEHRKGTFRTQKGPIFHNFILADEINRAPPKVQSALLEAMQERQVSIHGETFKLGRPFQVLATQNPIETEGTYKLPEAQVDRFIFKLLVDYPSKKEEKIVIQRNTQGAFLEAKNVLDSGKITQIQEFNQRIYADEKVVDYVVNIVDATRNPGDYGLDLDGLVDYGASPRASIYLILSGKAHALLNGRGYVVPQDIKAVAHDVLRHRLAVSYEAEAEDMSSDKIIEMVLSKIRSP